MSKKEWKWFLVKRFLLILLLVSFSEQMLAAIYEQMIFPWLSNTLHIDFFTAGLENGQTIGALLRGGCYLAVMGLCRQFPDVVGFGLGALSEKWAGSAVAGQITRQTAHMNQRQMQIYILGMIALTLLILITLFVPYVLAAFAFSQMVEMQIQRMEKVEQQQKEEYDRRRNLLLSDVAHDLKTPMTTVAGYSKVLLEETVLPKEGRSFGMGPLSMGTRQQEYLETIYNKSMQMSGLLNLLFEYVKLDSEGFQLKKTNEDLWELLRECVAGLYMDFEEKQMEMIPKIPEEAFQMDIDRIQFQRVVNNLLNNALRHNSLGTRVWILAEQEDEYAVIQICDDGETIPAETAKYIFEPFVLGDESRNSRHGSGLGLSIAHKIIAMHGGDLTLEQEEGEEYTKAFVIRLRV